MLQQTDQTLTKLRQLIQNGALGTDGRMPPERTLAEELGVGRRSLRRALDVLEQEGRITRHQGRGTFIHRDGVPVVGNGAAANGSATRHGAVLGRGSDQHALAGGISFDHLLEITNPLEVSEARLAIEPVMARLAALRASQADLRRLQAAVAETKAATDPVVYEQADERFHRTVAEAARNSLFLTLLDAFSASRRDAAWRRLSENAHCFKRQAVHAASHQEIYDAIAARNSERAYECMYRHLSDIQQHIYTFAFPQEQPRQAS